MRRSDSDLLRVPESQFDSLTRDELLRIVVLCRESDDPKAKRRTEEAWAMLVAFDRDRTKVLVALFRFAGQGNVRVARDNIEDVVDDCYLRMLGMLAGFEGAVLPQYEAAMATCVDFECRDHCRREMRLDQRRGGSLDETVETDDGGERGKFDSAIAKKEREGKDLEEALEVEMEQWAERRAQIRVEIERIKDDRKREVLLMTWEGKSVPEIMDKLGLSRDNVYQLRRRGLKIVQDMLSGDGEP
jgi:RNA polymerase sigma factor (sigma-70 family)